MFPILFFKRQPQHKSCRVNLPILGHGNNCACLRPGVGIHSDRTKDRTLRIPQPNLFWFGGLAFSTKGLDVPQADQTPNTLRNRDDASALVSAWIWDEEDFRDS